MRTIVMLTLALAFVSCAAYADLSATGVSAVTVKIDSNVAVMPVLPVVDLGSFQVGEFSASVGFAVRSNKQYVSFFVEATKLYKADIPSPESPQIPLLESKGVDITAPLANPPAGVSSNVPYVSNSTIGSYPARKTDTLRLESSQVDKFDQVVTAQVWWIQPDELLPDGDYSGKVALTALVN